MVFTSIESTSNRSGLVDSGISRDATAHDGNQSTAPQVWFKFKWSPFRLFVYGGVKEIIVVVSTYHYLQSLRYTIRRNVDISTRIILFLLTSKLAGYSQYKKHSFTSANAAKISTEK